VGYRERQPSPVTVSYRRSDDLSEVTREWPAAGIDELAGAVPWRSFRWYRGQKHYSGTYWSATNRDHVIYESRLELARLLFADFDATVNHFVAQPFFLRARVNRRIRRHIPDFLLFTDGLPRVVDVKPAARLSVEKVRFTLDWTRELVEELGWNYEAWSEPADLELRNLRFLAGFRNAERFDPELLKAILHQSTSDTTLGQVLGRDFGEPPARVRSAVLHLVWRRDLSVDITQPLTKSSLLVKGI